VHSNGHTCTVLLNYLAQEHKAYGIKDNIESPYIVINSDWETFLGEKSQKFRKTLRNKLNRASHSGDLSFERMGITGRNDTALRDMFSVSQKSWKKQVGTDILSNPASEGFYKEICDRLGPRGMVKLFLLKKAGESIAFEFHLTYNKTAYPIRADYDKSFKHISPGSILETHILKTLFDESRIQEYNSCGHTYDYLLKWTDDTRKYVNVEVFNKNFRSRSLHILEYKVIPVLRKMRLNRLKFH
jgi:CelD/BcsL family acetyltransferase involved in cellulose biosynthesis